MEDICFENNLHNMVNDFRKSSVPTCLKHKQLGFLAVIRAKKFTQWDKMKLRADLVAHQQRKSYKTSSPIIIPILISPLFSNDCTEARLTQELGKVRFLS